MTAPARVQLIRGADDGPRGRALLAGVANRHAPAGVSTCRQPRVFFSLTRGLRVCFDPRAMTDVNLAFRRSASGTRGLIPPGQSWHAPSGADLLISRETA